MSDQLNHKDQDLLSLIDDAIDASRSAGYDDAAYGEGCSTPKIGEEIAEELTAAKAKVEIEVNSLKEHCSDLEAEIKDLKSRPLKACHDYVETVNLSYEKIYDENRALRKAAQALIEDLEPGFSNYMDALKELL